MLVSTNQPKFSASPAVCWTPAPIGTPVPIPYPNVDGVVVPDRLRFSPFDQLRTQQPTVVTRPKRKKKQGFFGKLFGGVKKAFKSVAKVFSPVAKAVKKVVGGVTGVVGKVLSPVRKVFTAVTGFASKMLKPIAGLVGKAMPFVNKLLSPLGGMLKPIMSKVLGPVAKLLSPVTKLAAKILPIVNKIYGPIWKPMSALARTITGGTLRSIVRPITSIVSPILGKHPKVAAILGAANLAAEVLDTGKLTHKGLAHAAAPLLGQLKIGGGTQSALQSAMFVAADKLDRGGNLNGGDLYDVLKPLAFNAIQSRVPEQFKGLAGAIDAGQLTATDAAGALLPLLGKMNLSPQQHQLLGNGLELAANAVGTGEVSATMMVSALLEQYAMSTQADVVAA